MPNRRAARKLGGMSYEHANFIDCAGCRSRERCWSGGADADAGLMVRRVKPLEAGDILFRESDPVGAPYIVTSGCIILCETQPNGAERIVALRVPGEIVGLESLHRSTQRYRAEAVTSTTLCRLRWGVTGLAGRGAAYLRVLLAKSSVQLEQAAQTWAGHAAIERVRLMFQDFERRTDQPLPLTRRQIGQYLGLAEETVVRACAELKRRGESCRIAS